MSEALGKFFLLFTNIFYYTSFITDMFVNCNNFPSYCNASQPHVNCDRVMKAYYQVNRDMFACPACNLLISDWSSFTNNHAHHAGRFTKDQKKELSRCPTYSSYCHASIPHEDCDAVMKPYYKLVPEQYVCPKCKTIVRWDEFKNIHAKHAGRFRGVRKRNLVTIAKKTTSTSQGTAATSQATTSASKKTTDTAE